MTHIIPAGVFQPSGIAPWNIRADFDIWHSILRELSEEFLGNPDHDGSAAEPIDYEAQEPFASLERGPQGWPDSRVVPGRGAGPADACR